MKNISRKKTHTRELIRQLNYVTRVGRKYKMGGCVVSGSWGSFRGPRVNWIRKTTVTYDVHARTEETRDFCVRPSSYVLGNRRYYRSKQNHNNYRATASPYRERVLTDNSCVVFEVSAGMRAKKLSHHYFRSKQTVCKTLGTIFSSFVFEMRYECYSVLINSLINAWYLLFIRTRVSFFSLFII